MLNVLHIFRQLNVESGGPVTYLLSAQDALCAYAPEDVPSFELASFRGGESDYSEMPSITRSLDRFRLIRVLYLLMRRIGYYDCVHLHGLFGLHGVLGGGLALLLRTPLVISTHGNLHPAGMQKKALLKRVFSAIILRVLMTRAVAVIATGAREADRIQTLFPNASVEIVPPAVHVSKARAKTETAEQWLFVGRIHPHKGLLLVIEALAQDTLRQQAPTLNVVGVGEADYRFVCEQRAAQLGVTQQVVWHGFLAPDMRDQVAATCSFLVLPSYSENFSFATAEAMALGLPVIISKEVGLAECVLRYDAGLVFSVDDLDGLVACLQRMQEDEFRMRCGEAARRCVQQEMAPEVMGQRLMRIYRAAASERSAGRSAGE